MIFEYSKWLPGSHLGSDHKIDDIRWNLTKKYPNNVFSPKSPTWIVFELKNKMRFLNIQNCHQSSHLGCDHKIDDIRWMLTKRCPNNVFSLKSLTRIVFKLNNKMQLLNIQNGHQVAILDPIIKLMTSDESLLKSVLIMYFQPKALHA